MKWILIVFFGSALLCGFLELPIKAYKEVRRKEREAEHERRAREFEEQQEREFQETIRHYLRLGKKIDAIKECKDYYDCSLSKAKTIVSEIEFEMTYEREHGEDYRPYAHGRAYRDESTTQPTERELSHISNIDEMEGHEFEYFCADLLLKTGFEKADVTPGSGDQGVDIVAVKDGVKYAVQCKNYKTPLGNTPVQEVRAGRDYYDCHVAVVMTNSTFTPGAQKLADANRVLLWDRAYVEKLMEKAEIPNAYFKGEQSAESNENNVRADLMVQNGDSITDKVGSDEILASEPYVVSVQQERNSDAASNREVSSPKMRKGMKALMIFSLIYVGVFVLAGIGTDQLDMAVGMGGFSGILAIMFLVLAKSPKDSPFVLIRNHKIKKFKFVLLSIVAAFAFVTVVIAISGL